MNDVLERFRRRPIEPKQPPAGVATRAGSGQEVYEAFKPVDRERKRLHIRPSIQPWVFATYSYLQYIAEDNGRGTRFSLVFGFLVVVVRGRNLGEMISAINSENCEFIAEFDPDRYAQPEADAPFIESIEYHMDREKRAEVLDEVSDSADKRKREEA